MSAKMVDEIHNGYSWSDFYGVPERVDISAGDLNSLLRAEIVLQALMESGVHNWEGFDNAMAKAERMLK